MDKDSLLSNIMAERAEWDELIDRVGPERMEIPDVTGSWSVKDVIAHIMWFEREMIGVARAHALIGSSLWNLPQAERNEAVYEEFREMPLEQVLDEARQTYAQLLVALRDLDEADLNDTSRFRDMPAEWLPWQVIAGNTYEHYRAHVPDVRAWLARRGDGG